jgi:predicted Zn-dependent peptidase
MTVGVRIPPHRREVLPNGVQLVLLPREEVPLVAFEVLVRGGARLDPGGRAGVASLTAELLRHGAGARDAYAFADTLEGSGGSLDADAGAEAVLLHGQFLAGDTGLMLELLADALQRPHLGAAEFATLQTRRIEFIKAAKDSDPQSMIGHYGRALLYPEHPYGAPVGGSEASLARIGVQDVRAYYAQHFGADRLTLVFAGDFEPDRLRGQVEAAFGDWRRADAPLPPVPEPAPVTGRRVLLVDAPDCAQGYFWLANLGVARDFEPRAALETVNTAFGGSFGSMLMQALRTRTGLTYSAHSEFRRGTVAGGFAISSFADGARTGRAIGISLGTLDALKQRGLSAEALDSARNYLVGQYPLGFETAADWAAALGELALHGLPDSHIDDYGPALLRVDAQQARAVVAQAFPDSADLAIVLIGDSRLLRRQAARFGTLTERALSAPDFA